MSRNVLGRLADKRDFIFPTQRPTKHPAQTGKGRLHKEPALTLVAGAGFELTTFGL